MTRQISLGAYKHETDFEEKKKTSLADIKAARIKVFPSFWTIKHLSWNIFWLLILGPGWDCGNEIKAWTSQDHQYQIQRWNYESAEGKGAWTYDILVICDIAYSFW